MKYNLIGRMTKWPIRLLKNKKNEILAIHFVKDRQKNVYLLTQNYHEINQVRILNAIVLVFIILISFTVGYLITLKSIIIFIITILVAFLFHKIVPNYIFNNQIKKKGILLGNENNVLAKYFYDLISQNNLKVEYEKVPFFGQRANDPYLCIGDMSYTTPYVIKEGSGRHWSAIIILIILSISGIIFLLGVPEDFKLPIVVVISLGCMTYFSCYILFASMTKERTRQVELVNYIIDTFANKK